MKAFMRLLLMGAVITTLASCGKNNSSDGKKKSKTVDDTVTVVNTNGANYANYNDLKNAFTSMKMNSKVQNNQVIYHMGPDYTEDIIGGGGGIFNISFSGCIDLIFWSHGDCDYDPSTAQLQNIVENGSYKVVKVTNADSVDFDKAIGVENYMFDMQFSEYNRTADIYKTMLNLDNIATQKVVISKATVTLSDNSSVKADFVEYFFQDGTIKGFVLSTAFPLIANPIMNTQGSHSGYMASPQVVTGALSFAGTKSIKSIRVDTHLLNYDWSTNQSEAYNAGSLGISFN